MAEATDIPYHELTHVSDWYLREETIRRAIVALVDYHHSLPLSAVLAREPRLCPRDVSGMRKIRRESCPKKDSSTLFLYNDHR